MNVEPLTKQNVLENINRLMEIDNAIIDDDESWKLTNFLIDFPMKWQYSFLVMIDDKIVGFIICSVKENTLYVHRLSILEDFQNKKLGSKLIDLILELGSKDNLQNIMLQVKKYNTAKTFYKKKGFKKIGSNGTNYIYKKVIE